MPYKKIKVKPKIQVIKMKKISVVLDNDGKLHIEKYKKGYGVEGIITGKPLKFKYLKEKTK